jgi:UDP-glucose 4-epimerase
VTNESIVEPSAFAAKRCVVTGGLGFIGSNLVHRLVDLGASVTVIDGLIPKHGGDRRNLDGLNANVEVVVADIAETIVVAPVLEGADYVFNLAGQVSHTESMEDPLRDLDLNARSQLAFLETVRSVNPGVTIVYTSTRQVYGRPKYNPVDEEHPVNPVDVNGVNKFAAEQFHMLYANVHGLKASALRLTNVYGPRQRLRGDDQGFLPIFIRRAIEAQPLSLYGEGEQLRDCLYVDDVVDALLAAACSPDAVGEVMNIGHREPLSLRTIADAVVAAVGAGSVVSVPWPQERSQIDIGSFRSDVSKAKRILGWEPSLSFEEGIARTVEFYRSRLGTYL